MARPIPLPAPVTTATDTRQTVPAAPECLCRLKRLSPPPVPPPFPYKYIGTFGPASSPIATFANNGEIVNVRAGETFDGKFILRAIGIESAEIGYVGFPPETTTRVPIGPQ